VGGCLVATGLPMWFPHDWDALGLQPKRVPVDPGIPQYGRPASWRSDRRSPGAGFTRGHWKCHHGVRQGL